ncbi:MAG: Fic family protein, partial [Bdellovibrionota bacterium]
VLRAAVAHFWFVTIHPYEDGNGRLARAITDMALAQDEKTGVRLYSLSSQISLERDQYYEILERCQKQDHCDITIWLEWFLGMIERAFKRAKVIIDKTFVIARFWQAHSQTELNERQRKVLGRLLEAYPEDFAGGLNNRKYVSLTRTSRETAKRDLADLETKGLISRNSGKGRSVSYSLCLSLE